jgi:hypothetical protein
VTSVECLRSPPKPHTRAAAITVIGLLVGLAIGAIVS